MALSLRRIRAKKKIVSCTHCSEWMEVGALAMSVVCPKCRQRVIIEDYQIRSYHASRKLQTCGNVVVYKGATLSASTKAANMTVGGSVWGDVEVLGKLEVRKSGYMRGDVRASRLVVREGAMLEGYYEIGLMKIEPPRSKTGARVESPLT